MRSSGTGVSQSQKLGPPGGWLVNRVVIGQVSSAFKGMPKSAVKSHRHPSQGSFVGQIEPIER